MDGYAKGSATFFLVIGIVILALVVLGLFGYSVSKENAKNRAVEKEILSLQAQADSIKKENMALNERLAYLSSKDYQEVQAKDKLNLQNPGESVVIIAPKSLESGSVAQPVKDEVAPVADTTPNYRKWTAYFFSAASFLD